MNISRRSLLQNTAAAAALTGLSGAGCMSRDPLNPDLSKGPTIATLLQDATDLMLDAYPESASSAGVDKGKYDYLKSKLTDRTAAGQVRIANRVKAMSARLDVINTALLPADQALHVNVVRTAFSWASEGFDLPYGDMPLLNSNWSYRPSPYAVAQNTGAFVEIPTFLDSSHSIESEDDAEAYLSRMEAYAAQLDGETDRVLLYADQGVVLPDFLMDKTLSQLKSTRQTAVSDWGIVTSIASRTRDMQGKYAQRAFQIAEDVIQPAIERQIAVHEQIQGDATSDAGVWAKPGGDAYYDWALKASTTTNMTPDEIHQMGLDQLADLHRQMDPILRAAGYTQGSVGARMTALGKDPRYHFSDGDKGRAEIMAFIETTLAKIRSQMPRAFNTLVPGYLEVTRISPDVEDGAPGAYGGAGSIDGTQPGHFWINLRTPALHNKYNLADLTYHEAIPGHVWQGEYTFKQPLIRSLLSFNAYSEGWALYAQQIADELGVYRTFPVGRLGYLQSLAFRACRLVVDTGLHAKRWTREEAIDWFVTNNGSSREEVQGEVDRYCAWPGQACGYKVGHSAINRFREKARSALGDQFDYRAFNDTVVMAGGVPMTVLGDIVDGYIASQKT